jgi:uncharacterized integral membrane protein
MILFAGAIGSLVGMMLDERTVMGINVWIKPFKFYLSTAIYTLTVGFLVTLYPYSNLKKHILRNLVSWSMLLELVIITYQAARGVQSHFNTSNAYDGTLFITMGVLIGINVLVMVIFAFDTIRLKLLTTKAIQWSILMAWLIIIFGSWVGGQMIGQMAHSVGVADGGAGLPLLNWSTEAGDLRVAHFFGMHSLQLIPLFAFFLGKYWNGKHRSQVLIITAFALLYAYLVFYTFYQASEGVPFID